MDLPNAPFHLAGKDRHDSMGSPHAPDEITLKVGTPLAEAEKQLIRATLARYRSNKKVAALLGISLKTLYNKVKKYSLDGG